MFCGGAAKVMMNNCKLQIKEDFRLSRKRHITRRNAYIIYHVAVGDIRKEDAL